MKFQTFGLIIFFVIVGEFVQLREAYKSIRPYKYYRPRSRGHGKPRWNSIHGPTRYQSFKKGRRPYKHSHNRHRHPPIETWNEKGHVGKEPYTIEIELPKQPSSWMKDRHVRNYDSGTSEDFYSEEDYYDEDEDIEERVMKTGGKRVRVMVVKGSKPKLRIKISRDDHLDDIADSPSNVDESDQRYNLSSIYSKEFDQADEENWTPGNVVSWFPEVFRGA